MKKAFLLSTLLVLLPAWAQKPFTTDYCTAYPEGPPSHPGQWKHCCLEHDLYFWAGGSHQDRKETDIRLRDCVAATGATTQAHLMYLAVSVGGASPIRFKTREWGNSWSNRARYLKLTELETGALLHEISVQPFELKPELKNSFYKQLNSRLDL